jgi:transposase
MNAETEAKRVALSLRRRSLCLALPSAHRDDVEAHLAEIAKLDAEIAKLDRDPGSFR